MERKEQGGCEPAKARPLFVGRAVFVRNSAAPRLGEAFTLEAFDESRTRTRWTVPSRGRRIFRSQKSGTVDESQTVNPRGRTGRPPKRN